MEMSWLIEFKFLIVGYWPADDPVMAWA